MRDDQCYLISLANRVKKVEILLTLWKVLRRNILEDQIRLNPEEWAESLKIQRIKKDYNINELKI